MTTKRVIIVDDTKSVGRLVESTLTTLGIDLSMTVVPSAEEALLESGLYQVDLIVTDYHLPGISGIELAKRVQKRAPGTKVILMSGMDDSTLETQAIEAGAIAFFAKPLDLERFIEKTRALLSLTKDRQVETQAANGAPVIDTLPEPSASLSEILGDLRNRLGAHSVLLLGEDGHITAQAGDLPHIDFESVWITPLMTMVSSSQRVSRLVDGDSNAMVMTLRAAAMDLLLAPVGAFGLVITLDSGGSGAAAVDETMTAQRELMGILENMGLRALAGENAPAPEPVGFSETEPAVSDESDSRIMTGELEALFEGKSNVSQDADAFWDELGASSGSSAANPDALSFEEAQKLGLAPDDFI